MSLDDQLFKRDGTLITDIDILILKFSRIIANLFTNEDEETYSNAMQRMLKTVWLFIGIAAVFYFVAGNNSLGFCCALSGFLFALSNFGAKKCTGEGTLINHWEKKYFFTCLIAVLIILPVALLAQYTNWRFMLIGALLHQFGVWTDYLAIFYVKRLQNVPPKKKKVKVFQLAHNPAA